MTQDEIIEMAKQIATQASKVGPYRTWTHEYAMSLIMQLVDASAAKEREACAKVCEAGINNATDWDSSAWDQACENRSYAIRARGAA